MISSHCPECHAPIVWLPYPANPTYQIPAEAATVTGEDEGFDGAIHKNHVAHCPATQFVCAGCGHPAIGFLLTLHYAAHRDRDRYQRIVHAAVCESCLQTVPCPPGAEFCRFRLPSPPKRRGRTQRLLDK